MPFWFGPFPPLLSSLHSFSIWSCLSSHIYFLPGGFSNLIDSKALDIAGAKSWDRKGKTVDFLFRIRIVIFSYKKISDLDLSLEILQFHESYFFVTFGCRWKYKGTDLSPKPLPLSSILPWIMEPWRGLQAPPSLSCKSKRCCLCCL